MEPIDASKIIWIKSVDNKHGDIWAYSGEDPAKRHFEPQRAGDEFNLHWPNAKHVNATRPCRGDIICLVQHMHVTHLVKVCDDQPHDRPAQDCRPGSEDAHYAVARRVRVLAMRGKGRAPHYSQALRFMPGLQGGPCCEIAKLKRFKESHWPSQGGLTALQQHLVRVFTGQA
ncbi:MAG: hypothetical protein ACREX3_16425 [Gammaproteobacteria bacterium]